MIPRVLLYWTASLLLFQTAFSQKIIVNGRESNGKLSWEDYTGKPDKSSPFYACTANNINYNYDSVEIFGDSVIIKGNQVILELDPIKSWINIEMANNKKANAELLIHEQGHFNLGILCMNEILTKYKNSIFQKSNFNNLLQTMFSETLSKYMELGVKYDKETDNSKNKEQQLKWNAFFETELAKKPDN